MKFSVITVCHKSSKKISEYVNSFLCHHSQNTNIHEYEFIFVENSGDVGIAAAVEPLKQAGFAVKIINSENYGFGAGCNLGANVARGRTLLFVNPDIQFLGNIDGLAEFVGKDTWGTVCQLRPNGHVCSFDLFPEYKYWMFWLAVPRLHVIVNKFRKAFSPYCYVVGSFLVVDKGLFERCGGFNPRFFLYYEEAELCRRLKGIAGLPFYAFAISILHEGSGSQENASSETIRNEARGFLTYVQVTNQFWLVKQRLRQMRLLSPFHKATKKGRNALMSALSDRV
jgi:GT2 family glycosyltransferase